MNGWKSQLGFNELPRINIRISKHSRYVPCRYVCTRPFTRRCHWHHDPSGQASSPRAISSTWLSSPEMRTDAVTNFEDIKLRQARNQPHVWALPVFELRTWLLSIVSFSLWFTTLSLLVAVSCSVQLPFSLKAHALDHRSRPSDCASLSYPTLHALHLISAHHSTIDSCS